MTMDEHPDGRPGDPSGGMALAETADHVSSLLAVGQRRRAQEVATRLIARAPDDPSAHLVLSQVHLVQQNLPAALAAADQAVRLAPDDDRAHAQRARTLLAMGRFAAAERAVAEALALDPADASTHLLRARLLWICDRSVPALAAVEKALRLDPEETDAHQLRALLLLEVRPRDWVVSEATARRAVELDPDDADAHAVLGAVFLHSRRFAQAEERLRAALLLDPANALALRALAEALMARSFVYRPLLRLSLLLQHGGPGLQLAVIAGAWALVNAAVPLLREGAAPWPSLVEPVQWGYLAFCAYTWFAGPVVRGLLNRRYPWLRRLP